jgi:glycosyltransferase involved in cell wall biosynthesis
MARYSVLIPTRNRLSYLRYAVESTLRQDFEDWEVIVADNASNEDVAGFIASLNEPRVRLVSSVRAINVTENWNRALAASTGEWVIMLGDDDCLLPRYFSRMNGLIKQFADPDLIYTGAWLYAYPHVDPEEPNGYLQHYGYASFMRTCSKPRILTRHETRRVVEKALNFRVVYGFNMQFACIHRTFIAKIANRGPFFQSPFPDYFAMNAAFLMADRILAVPENLVLIGITSKSYGYYYANNKEAAGIAFLAPDMQFEEDEKLQGVLLPGSNINSSWLRAMETLRWRYAEELNSCPSYNRYRLLQVLNVYCGYYGFGTAEITDVIALNRELHAWERLLYAATLDTLFRCVGARGSGARRRVALALDRISGRTPQWPAERIIGRYQSALEVLDAAASGDLSVS